MAEILGIDVGGTGIKGAIVDTEKGMLVTEKVKYGTPQPSIPSEVIKVISQIKTDLGYDRNDFGCGFPSVIKKDICLTAANIDDAWIDMNLRAYFMEHMGCDVTFTNDADAAALAEMRFGQGKDRMGTVVLLTLGTGIGSGIFLDGMLLPNSEFGHLLYKKSIFEHYASNGARLRKKMGWKSWGRVLNIYLNHIDLLLSPDLIILGGGVSKYFDKFKKYIAVTTELVPAAMGNTAGIIGAAMVAMDHRSEGG